MTSILPHPEHAQGGSGPGWPFGSEIETAERERRTQYEEAADNRPQVSLGWFVQEVANMLRARGTKVILEGREQTTEIAAADLLRAMGVRPASAPER